MKPGKLFILTLALLCALSARGGNIYNVPFDLTEVNALSRDGKGMMWFGSKYGLYSYNGFNLRKFVNPEYPDGDGACVQVLLPHGDKVCVATERGVCSLDTYTFAPDASLRVSASWSGGKGLPELLRFGQRMVLPRGFGSVSWYGRGPWENYSDRKTASFLGLWSSRVEDMFFPYVRPQESGARSDVRWVRLTDADGVGIAVVAVSQPLCFTATDIRQESVDPGLSKAQRHIGDIHRDRTRIWLNIDLLQRGLGGDDSWGRPPHKEYLLVKQNYEYSYMIVPVRP